MLINAHCHVFTFKTFLTVAATENLKYRITSHHVSEALANDLIRLIRKLFLGDNAEAVVAQCERYLSQRGLVNISLLQFIKRGCLDSIGEVTDALLSDTDDEAETGEETLVTPLMMDVISADASEADRALYREQSRQTIQQSVRYPGRVLPFVAVNPCRGPEALDILHQALEEGLCAGVKLYPSAGFTMTDPMIDKIMSACQACDAPVTMHCNDGGFCGPGYDFTYCSPVSWSDVVRDYDVRFNFAHFGDQDPAKVPTGSKTLWRDTITALMDRFPDRVYADVSYQSGPLGDAGVKERYLIWLKEQLASSRQGNILWGTDNFMLYLSCDVANYWRFFQQNLPRELFRQMAEDNPKRFLGLPEPGQHPVPDSLLARHVAYLRRQKQDNPTLFASASPPAGWLKPLL